MGEWISLDTPTSRIRGWRADPTIPPRGGLVVVQEIFGVNSHAVPASRTLRDPT